MFEIDSLASIITITKVFNDISKWMHVNVYLVGVLGSFSQIYVIEFNEWFFRFAWNDTVCILMIEQENANLFYNVYIHS